MFDKVLRLRFDGVRPLLLHNGDLANPFNEFVKQMKTIQAKKKKTEEDIMELCRIEWLGSLYLRKKRIVIPSEMVESCLAKVANAADRGLSKDKLRANVFCENDCPIRFPDAREFEGVSELEELYEDGKYRDVRKVKIGKSTVLRCRPRFDEWSIDVELQYRDMEKDQLLRVAELAGKLACLGDYRPKFGQFSVTEVS